MISGRFDDEDRPVVAGSVGLDWFDVSGPVTFLVDTGSSLSILSFADAARLSVDFTRFDVCSADTVAGTGDAESSVYLAQATISLREADGATLYSSSVTIGIAARSPRSQKIPDYSALGRDVLNELRLVVHRRRDVLAISR